MMRPAETKEGMMIIRRTLTLSACLAAVLAAGAALLAATGDAYAVTITHGGCHEIKTLMCPAGNGGRHPPPGGRCRVVTRWVC
jgi:hypothetical protein